ncbi:tetratricopeptide repeat protein [Undibacterium seohonense]|uniref:Tetratricopeptide repeat protein n=1 Tax=Undibacterium seohonense TaxID=1344950 RepID=A0ABR6X2U1_9BURK|nr:tetratricopeptide repeat protein [Undibacterium seohonense]MBC3807219.1 tetratricopeptide repeat protein [Undibacterium seohonense]
MTTASNFKTIFQDHQAGKLAEALTGYLRLLEQEPQHVDALVSLATLYLQLGKPAESAHYFETALAIQPRKLLARHNYALCLKQQKKYDQALAQFDLAIAVDPQYELAYKNKFALLEQLGRQAERLAGLQEARQLLPHSLDLTLLLVASLREAKHDTQALQHIEHLLSLKPKLVMAHNTRGNILLDLGRADDAVQAYLQAIQLQADYAKAHGNLAIAYLSLAKYEQALASFDRALQLDPELPGMRNNRANALQNLHRFDEAVQAYDEILKRDPRDNIAAANKGMLCLLLGRFKEGWPLYEARWQNVAMSVHNELFAYPLWNGRDSLQNKIIIVHPEQGYGDTIQFSRYARLLASQAEQVYLVVNPPLHQLMLDSVKQWPECRNIDVISAGAKIPAFHYQLPLLSAPRVLKTELDTIPNFGTYLFADADYVARWQASLGEKRKSRIGIVWAGSDKHSNDKNRSVPLNDLLNIFQQELRCELEFHALQKDIKDSDAARLNDFHIQNHAQELDSFSDTAALIMQMDLVISVDTSVAHLAAALGVATWILLPHVPDFRWLLGREDSPWYDSVRLFRQTQARDWTSALQQLAQACNQTFAPSSISSTELAVSQLNLANDLLQQGHWQQAESIYRQEFVIHGGNAKLHNNWGVALQKLRRFDEALAAFDLAMQLDATYVSPHLNKAMCLLSLGQFEEGWRLYEWRWKNAQWHTSRRVFSQPLWLGEETIAGKKILIYAEQGLGDTLQFCRFIEQLQSLGADVMLEVPAALLALLACLPVDVYLSGTAPQDFDYQCPLLSLPLALKLRVDTIPQHIPYLQAPESIQQAWQDKIAANASKQGTPLRKKIGVVWAGSALHSNDAQRSLSLTIFSKLFGLDADFYILQKDLKRNDRISLEMMQRFGKRIFILESALLDFTDTAAAINCLDLVIAVDTSVAHLTGALGKPLYLLLPYEADFRWLQSRQDSPWYPSARLFRQQQVGDWTEAMAQLQQQLALDLIVDNGIRI